MKKKSLDNHSKAYCKIGIGFFSFSLPTIVLAQMHTVPTMFEMFIGRILDIMRSLAIIVISLAVVLFLWGLLKFVISDSPDKRKEAKGFLINGIIILLVMTSLWGLVQILKNTFILTESNAPMSGQTGENINMFR